jgi:hypothetical protein
MTVPERNKKKPKPPSTEMVAMRRIDRVLNDLEEDARTRVLTAVSSLYAGPAGREKA